jgi:hypothetical protein
MKKIFVLALCVVSLTSIASAFTLIENPVFLNGKPFAKAVTINGVIYISVQELATAAGGTLTLESAGLKLSGGTLSAVVPNVSANKFKEAKKANEASVLPPEQQVPAVQQKAAIKGESRAQALLRVNKAGRISSRVINGDGKAWVPLSDVAKALNTHFDPQTVKGREAIQLQCPSDPSAILIGLL